MQDQRHTSSVRRLAAIMFTDIVGYTTLMGKDEDLAFKILRRNREIQQTIIKKYNGEWLKEMGDGILASFYTASDAVRCAGEIQHAAKKEGIPLRIGIHEGEVVFEGSDVFGEGVNIASRLEEISDKGEIKISAAVYKNIKNKSGITAELVGEQTLKNVDEPVKIYTVTCEKSKSDMSYQSRTYSNIPKKKSIIVLPFEDISPDQDNEFFSDGLTEEIITDLSHVQDILVISRNSSMTFKSTKKKTTEIAREVNVQYVLEGSVRKAGNNLRIVAQLIDAISDTHIWAEKYRGTLDDIFDIQEKVSRSIVDALKIRLNPEESRKINEHPIDNLSAYECYLRARQTIMLLSEEGLNRAEQLIKTGLDIIGENELLNASLGYVYTQFINVGVSTDDSYLKKAEEHINIAFSINKDSAFAHCILGQIYWKRADIQKAVKELKRALEIDPNFPEALYWLAWIYQFSGKILSARPLLEKLVEIDPLTAVNYMMLGNCELFKGDFKDSNHNYKKAVQMEPRNPLCRFVNAYVLLCDHMYDEAFEIIDDMVKQMPEEIFTEIGLLYKRAFQLKKSESMPPVSEKLSGYAARDEMFSIFMADCHVLFNKKDDAIIWLERGIKWGFINYPFLHEHDVFLENIRDDDHFKKLMEKVKIQWENFQV